MHLRFGSGPKPLVAGPRFGNDPGSNDTQWQKKLNWEMRMAYSEYQRNLDDKEVQVLITAHNAEAALQALREQGYRFDLLMPDPPILTGPLRMSQLEAVAKIADVEQIEKSRDNFALQGRLFFGERFERRKG